MQTTAEKILQLIGQLGLKQYVVAKAVGYHPITLIKKANAGTRYPPEKIEKISQVLGITTSFLLDESREYIEGQPIPEDAILKVTPPPAPDIDPMASFF